jgi:hypothetical protein
VEFLSKEKGKKSASMPATTKTDLRAGVTIMGVVGRLTSP